VKQAVDDIGLRKEDFSVLTSNDDLNAELGCNDPENSRVLFTTQQMLLSRCKDRSFEKCADFHYQHGAREVRVWDEAILPSRILILNRDKLLRIVKDLRSVDTRLGECIDDFCARLKEEKHGASIDVPDLSEYAALEEALALVPHQDDRRTVEALFSLQASNVRLIKDSSGSTMLQYVDILPSD
jgi:hypothetical protein